MKKTLVLLILILGWSVSMSGQQKPVQPYKKNGYINAEFELFALGTKNLNISYKLKFLDMVTFFYKKTGLYEKYNMENFSDNELISFTYSPSRTWTEYRDGKNDKRYGEGFWNTRQSIRSDSIEWFWDENIFQGNVLVLHLDGYKLDLGKIICTNLVSVPWFSPEKVDEPLPVEEKRQQLSQLPYDYGDYQKKKDVMQDMNLPIIKERKDWVGGKICLGGGIVLSAGLTAWGIIEGVKYLNRSHNKNPGGAPVTPDPVTPVETGGPGGAPTTTGGD